MTVSYKLIPTSGKLASKKPFKALCAPYATASLQEMGRNIERGTTFSMSDLAGAFEALSKELKAQLLAGNRVHLPGLGFFSLAIKGELRTHPRTHRPRLLRPQVRTIRFQGGNGTDESGEVCAAESTSAQQSYALSLNHRKHLD